MLEAARELKRLVGSRVKLILNDRADLTLAAGFDGVHLGQGDLSPRPPEASSALIGYSASPPTIQNRSPKRARPMPTTWPSAPSSQRLARRTLIQWSASMAYAGQGN